jgi:formylmethanofuran:tetrahydromethanopterin formyltransferase
MDATLNPSILELGEIITSAREPEGKWTVMQETVARVMHMTITKAILASTLPLETTAITETTADGIKITVIERNHHARAADALRCAPFGSNSEP